MVSFSISYLNVQVVGIKQIPKSRFLSPTFTYKRGQSTFTRNNLSHYFISEGTDCKKAPELSSSSLVREDCVKRDTSK